MLEPRPTGKKVIKIYYVTDFPPGKCIVAVVIPSSDVELGKLKKIEWTHYKGCHYPPNTFTTDQGVCLRIVHRLEDVRPKQYGLIFRRANKLAEWARKKFGMETVVSCIGDLDRTRHILNIID